MRSQSRGLSSPSAIGGFRTKGSYLGSSKERAQIALIAVARQHTPNSAAAAASGDDSRPKDVDARHEAGHDEIDGCPGQARP